MFLGIIGPLRTRKKDRVNLNQGAKHLLKDTVTSNTGTESNCQVTKNCGKKSSAAKVSLVHSLY